MRTLRQWCRNEIRALVRRRRCRHLLHKLDCVITLSKRQQRMVDTKVWRCSLVDKNIYAHTIYSCKWRIWRMPFNELEHHLISARIECVTMQKTSKRTRIGSFLEAFESNGDMTISLFSRYVYFYVCERSRMMACVAHTFDCDVPTPNTRTHNHVCDTKSMWCGRRFRSAWRPCNWSTNPNDFPGWPHSHHSGVACVRVCVSCVFSQTFASIEYSTR